MDTQQTSGQIVASVAVQTLQTLLPTIIGSAAKGMSPQSVAMLTLLPAFVQAAETMHAAGGATPEQLAVMFASISGSIQSEHDQFIARQAARTAEQNANVPSTLANQAA